MQQTAPGSNEDERHWDILCMTAITGATAAIAAVFFLTD